MIFRYYKYKISELILELVELLQEQQVIHLAEVRLKNSWVVVKIQKM